MGAIMTKTIEQVRQENLQLKYKVLLNRPLSSTPKDLDKDEWLSGASYTDQELQEAIDWEAFKKAHPELEADQCREMLVQFLKTNVLPLSLKNLNWAHDYLSAAGLIVELEEDIPPEADKPVFKNTEVREEFKDNIQGFDELGNPRVYTSLQVEAMSSDEYQRKILGLRRKANIYGPNGVA